MLTRLGARRALLGSLVLVFVLVLAGSAIAAVVGLPGDGSQVNNDPAAGIDPAKDAGNSDIVGGSLTGGLNVPWATFEQGTTGQPQIFVRAFKGGQWVTQGQSLNFEPAKQAEQPSIDFAGANRAVPWDTWYEDGTTGFAAANQNVFASRFNAATGQWVISGQGRNAANVPTLNIDPDQVSEGPQVAGGATIAGAAPGPWIVWQETATVAPHHPQIFVVKPLGPGRTDCTGVKPAAFNPANAPNGGFCWQQVGIERSGTEPTLNVDPARDGVVPDIAFTGPNDTVPWVTWYEENGLGGQNQLVFMAKGIPDAAADGGFHWDVVSNTVGVGGTLNTGTTCRTTFAAEQACSVNKDNTKDAEDPSVAAGTMTPGGTTAPWVAWKEDAGGVAQIFVSRLVGGNHFELANAGQPVSLPGNPSTVPDISFAGNTPYVSWIGDTGGGNKLAFTGHFVDAANPTFKLDTPGGVKVSPPGLALGARPSISTGCTANPFTADGSSCPGGAVGTPFFLFTDGNPGTQKLFARAYQPTGVSTGGASGVGETSGTVSGSVNPEGAAVKAHFDFGTSTGYGSNTPDQVVGVSNSSQSFTAGLGGLPSNTVIHYRAVVTSDFGTQVGGDQTFTTAAAPSSGPPTIAPPPALVGIDRAPPIIGIKLGKIKLKTLLKTGKLPLIVTADEASTDVITATTTAAKARKASAAAKKKKKRRRRPKTVTLGSARVTFTAPGSKSVSLTVSRAGKRALRHRRSVKIGLKIKATDLAGNSRETKTSVSVR